MFTKLGNELGPHPVVFSHVFSHCFGGTKGVEPRETWTTTTRTSGGLLVFFGARLGKIGGSKEIDGDIPS